METSIPAPVSRPATPVPPTPSKPGSRLYPGSLPVVTQTTAIDLDVTDGCNLGCVYCFKNLDRPNTMKLETAKDAIEWLFRASGNASEVSVNFMGGEPTLQYRMLRELVAWGNRRARSVGKTIQWSFTSNMTLWTDEIRQWVDEHNIGVLMSIDGHPLIQDAQRPSKDGKPQAETVAKWARSLLQTRPHSPARFTISPKYVHMLAEGCFYLWDEIGFRTVIVGDADYDNWTEEHYEIYDAQCDLIVDRMVEGFRNGKPKNFELFSHYIKRLIHPRRTQQEVARQNFPCGAGYNYSMIDQEGTIWPCHRFDGAAEDSGTEEVMKLGNIYSEDYNEELSNAFRNFDHSRIHKEACTTCPVEPICGGFCPAANLQSGKNNTIYAPPDEYCQLKWISYRKAEVFYDRMMAIDSQKCVELINSWNLNGLA